MRRDGPLEVAYGDGSLAFEAPAGMEVERAPEPAAPEEEPEASAGAALRAPLGSAPLAELARRAASAVVAIPDGTRASPTAAVLPLLLAELRRGGVREERVTVLAAVGLHRAMSEDEWRSALGSLHGTPLRRADHDASGRLLDLGTGPYGTPLSVSALLGAAGLVLSVGCVEPHQYAGWSGGWKTVAIGCAGEATIAHTHAPRFTDHPRCRPGVTDGNPFLDVLREAGRRAGHAFALNVIPLPGGAVAATAAGAPEAVHAHLAERARSLLASPVGRPADVVVAGVGAPKDGNLYQASRAATNLVLGAIPAVAPGGTVIVAARCPEGFGGGEGERRFAEALLAPGDAGAPPLGGTQRARMLRRVLRDRRVVVAGSTLPAAELEARGLGAATGIDDALAAAAARGARRLLVVRDGVRFLPVPARRAP